MPNVNKTEPMTAEEYEEARQAEEAYYQERFGMSVSEYEAKATEEIAKTAHFEKIPNSHYWHCLICKRRYHEHYAAMREGDDLNNRMINHFRRHQSGDPMRQPD